MKKKGFTLVELLAVIVILAIIALIAVPIVLKTINNSEEQAEKQSILGYARVIEDDKANFLMLNPGQQYQIKSEEDYDYKGNKVFCENRYFDEKEKLVLEDCIVANGDKKPSEEEIAKKNHYNYKNGKVEKIKKSSNQQQNDNNNNTSKTAVAELLSKTNAANVTTYESGSEASHQMYTFSHPATEQTEALTDYRYIGNDPYNYVEFNDEVWRIIGIFTVKNESKTEQRIKIIRDEKLPDNMPWDYEENGNPDSENEWSSATLNTYLNGDYYESLSDSAKSMIDPAETYLGGRESWRSTISWGTSVDIYNWERGTSLYSYQIPRSLNDTKNITLAYPSDYIYTYANGVDNTCYSDYNMLGGTPNTGWLYKTYNWWLVSPESDCIYCVFSVNSNGYVDNNYGGAVLWVRPVTYLKSSVQIESGTGTSSDPYKLKIES